MVIAPVTPLLPRAVATVGMSHADLEIILWIQIIGLMVMLIPFGMATWSMLKK
jgi:hypothetical protein